MPRWLVGRGARVATTPSQSVNDTNPIPAQLISMSPLPWEAPAYAAFDYNIEQIAPALASQLTMADIAAILNETMSNPSSLEIFQLATTDASGHLISVAPLKVAQTNSTVCRNVTRDGEMTVSDLMTAVGWHRPYARGERPNAPCGWAMAAASVLTVDVEQVEDEIDKISPRPRRSAAF